MKAIVVTQAHDIAQQPFLVDGRAAVADLDVTPVGLLRDRTVAAQQMAGEGFAHGRFIAGRAQPVRGGVVVGAFHIEPIKAQALQIFNALGGKLLGQDQLHAHAWRGGRRNRSRDCGIRGIRSVGCDLLRLLLYGRRLGSAF